MARYPSPGPTKAGSRYWLEHFVNDRPDRLDAVIGVGPIEWVSPVASDDYAEYRDEDFLIRLRLEPAGLSLHEFWPNGGLRWDALGIAGDGGRVILEAKSSIQEMFTSLSVKSPEARSLIQASLRRTIEALGATPSLDWSAGFYQYANRLAHGYWLNDICAVPTKLVFLHFVGEHTKKQAATREQWQGALLVLHEALGIRGKLPSWVREVFLDVADRRPASNSTPAPHAL